MPLRSTKQMLAAGSFLLALNVLALGTAGATALAENFDGGLPAGWTVKNLSSPGGLLDWFVGDPFGGFSAQQGASSSYLAANYDSGSAQSFLSDWLIMPTSTYHNGDTLSFYTRTANYMGFADNLQVRFSSVGGTDVGSTFDSVGTFGTLLLDINPSLAAAGYPDSWTQYTLTLSGLTGASNGAFAFRYVVPNGGSLGTNSNYIGIDTVRVTQTVADVELPEPASYLLAGLGLAAIALVRQRRA